MGRVRELVRVRNRSGLGTRCSGRAMDDGRLPVALSENEVAGGAPAWPPSGLINLVAGQPSAEARTSSPIDSAVPMTHRRRHPSSLAHGASVFTVRRHRLQCKHHLRRTALRSAHGVQAFDQSFEGEELWQFEAFRPEPCMTWA